jgi:hypothetical protein
MSEEHRLTRHDSKPHAPTLSGKSKEQEALRRRLLRMIVRKETEQKSKPR